MQSTALASKERKLKRNVEVNTARAIKTEQESAKAELSLERKAELRKAFEDSAQRIDQSGKLVEVWNDPTSSEEVSARPSFGYFGGVNFDETGKIIK